MSLREADEDDVPAVTALINEAYGPAEGFLYEGLRITVDEVRQKLALQGAEPAPTDPERFAKLIRDDVAKWTEVIRAAGIRPE